MEGYGYPYTSAFSPIRSDRDYPDHGDGFGDYYAPPVNEDPSKRSVSPEGWQCAKFKHHYCGDWVRKNPYYYWTGMIPDMPPYPYISPPIYELYQRPSCSKYNTQRPTGRRSRSHGSRSRSPSRTRTDSRSRSKTQSKSRSRSRSRFRSGTRSHSRSVSQRRELTYKEPSLLDAFRVMYLTQSKHRKSTTKYLATKKKQDRVQEILKSDGLGSKHWFFYPRVHTQCEPVTGKVAGARDNTDQRIKVDGDFFRKYKKSRKVDSDAPITKLKRWELVLYKKLGFVQAV